MSCRRERSISRTTYGLATICIVIVSLVWVSFEARAQTTVSFNSNTPFTIPNGNGTIYFAFNGSYSRAELEGDTWVFSDLQLTDGVGLFGDLIANPPLLKSFRVSTRNCNITITALFVLIRSQDDGDSGEDYFTRSGDMGYVGYNVTGPGIQTFNFGLSPTFGLSPRARHVTVRLDRDLIEYNTTQQKDGWNISNDGTITITGSTRQAFISCSDYSSKLIDENLPLYQNRPVLISSLVLVAIVVLVGVGVRVKSARSEGKL